MMVQYIDKAAVVAEIEERLHQYEKEYAELSRYEIWITAKEIEHKIKGLKEALSILDTLEVKEIDDKNLIQYDSIKARIESFAQTYSFNIESQLFPQLTKEQQGLWRKEIEEACINGGDEGYLLAQDIRYKENIEVKEIDLEKEIKDFLRQQPIVARSQGTNLQLVPSPIEIAKYAFELGLKAQKGE